MDLQLETKIKTVLRNKLESFFSSIMNEDIRRECEKSAFVAGGAIASLANGDEPNDFDLYFKTPTACKKIAEYFLELMDAGGYQITTHDDGVSLNIPGAMLKTKKSEEDYFPFVATANAITLTGEVQLIVRFTGTPDEITSNFDFLHSLGTYDYAEDRLNVSDEALEVIHKKTLVYTGSTYPLASIIRTRKFIKRGWNLNAGQYLKMAFQLNGLDLMDPAVLKEQLVGVDFMYFAKLLSALDENRNLDLLHDKSCENIFELIDQAFERNEEDKKTEVSEEIEFE